jgi:hypothetical protein
MAGLHQVHTMNATELADRLKREGYDRRWYSFAREAPPLEGFILEKVRERWTVFYFERGETRDIANFESEYDACEFFYKRMYDDFGSALSRRRH